MPSAPRWIIHLDMDAFYAAVEQHDQPSLRGKPVIVGGRPDSRGVVSTCSYEARRFGVHSAMPLREAARRCPHGHLRPRAHVALRRGLPAGLRHPRPVQPAGRAALARRGLSGRHRVREAPRPAVVHRPADWWPGSRPNSASPASVGIAPNKFLAKVASDLRKPVRLRGGAAGGGRDLPRRPARRPALGRGAEDRRAPVAHGDRDHRRPARHAQGALVGGVGRGRHPLHELSRGPDDAGLPGEAAEASARRSPST